MRPLVLALAAAAVVAAVRPAAAQRLADYRIDNDAWNGLSSLALVAEHLGATVEIADHIDLGSLGAAEVIWLVYPTAPLPATAIRDWVQRGGRLVVADDFGTSPALAAEFGLQRVPSPGTSPLLYGNPALELVTPLGRHELTQGVLAIATNHATALQGPGLAVAGWNPSEGLIYDMLLGQGRAVFISDPSLLTNLMLPLRDNAVLTRNLLAATCGGNAEGCRIRIATGAAAVTGAAQPGAGQGRTLDMRLDALRDLLEGARHADIDPEAAHLIAVILAIGASVLVAMVFPFRRSDRSAPLPEPGSTEFEASISRFSGPLSEVAWDVPGAMVREAIGPLIARGLGWEGAHEPTPSEIREALNAWVARWEPSLRGRQRRARVRRLAAEVARLYQIPRRQALLLGNPPSIREPDVRRMYDTLLGMIRTMGADDQLSARLSVPE